MPRRKRSGNPPEPEPEMIEQDEQDQDDVLIAGDDPFEASNDEIADGLREHATDQDRVDLSSFVPDPIDARQSGPTMLQPDGTWTRQSTGTIGRPVMPPLWRHAHLEKSVPQLRVWKVINGINHDVGAIDSMACEEEFIAYFLPSMPKLGEPPVTFMARPMDAQGNLRAEEFPIMRLGPDHATLRRLREVHIANAPAAPPSANTGVGDIASLVQQMMGPMMAQMQATQAEARAAREMAMQQIKQGADERVEMSARLGGTAQTLTETLLQRGSEQAQAQAKVTTDVFMSLQDRERADRERERDRNEARLKEEAAIRKAEREEAEDRRRREREDEDRRRQHERDEAEAKRVAAERDAELKRTAVEREWQMRIDAERTKAEERAREDQRRYEMRMAEDKARLDREQADLRRRDEERDKERQRQHELRLAEIESSAKRDREHAERMMMMQKNDSPQGAIDQLSKLAGGFGIDLKEVAKQLTDKLLNPPDDTDVAGTVEGITKGIGEALVKPMIDLAKTVKQVEGMKAQAAAGVPPALAGEQRQIPAQQQGQTAGQQQSQVQQPPPDNGKRNPADAFPIREQKTFREALSALVHKLRQTPEEQWGEAVMVTVSNEPGLANWFKALTIRGALVDIQAPQDFITKVLTHPLLNNPFLSDIPKG
jgi:hypothetical protein